MTIRKAVIGTLVAALLLGIPESRAVTLNWDATASSGLWEPAANWGGTSPPGSEILVFDNNVQTSMTNDAVNTTRNQIIFNAGATTARTIGGSTANDFVAVGLDNPLLQNNSTGSHVLNFPISVGADGLTIDTVTAPLTLGGAVSGSGTVTKIGGLSTGGGIGNVVVSASNSGFTDKWNIEGGIFSINNDAALGGGAGFGRGRRDHARRPRARQHDRRGLDRGLGRRLLGRRPELDDRGRVGDGSWNGDLFDTLSIGTALGLGRRRIRGEAG